MLKLNSNGFFYVQTGVKIFRDAISQVEIACPLQRAQPQQKKRGENGKLSRKRTATHTYTHTCIQKQLKQILSK